ncbi:MAG: polyphosphate kinase 2 [Candidatus Puniceispirillaceae bacterium]
MEKSQDHYRAFDDLIDEILELDFEDMVVSKKLRQAYQNKHSSDLSSKDYYHHLLDLQSEMIKVQDWVKETGAKILIICEGRDSAGKGSVIKRISQRMDPRVARVVALPKPTDREMSQWYFQRYVPHLPAGGEIVFFDRSWYNRAGVERVMEFASHEEIEQFFQDVPEFEKMLVRSGIILLKYWFSISDEEQQMRFLMRIHDPMKQWKLSEMDLQARVRWEQYTKAKEEMFERTSSAEAPWYIVEGNDKRRERLNCMAHILSKIPFKEIKQEKVSLPNRVFNPDYERQTLPNELYVPKIF